MDNAIRYSNVFDNVDFQYTVLGNTIKEDIILLKPQERNEFSYYLKSDSLKFKKQDGCVVAYETSADEAGVCLPRSHHVRCGRLQQH